MRIIRAAAELKPAGRKVSLGIGFFDGAHLGHQQIIRQTLTDAKQHEAIGLVITFDQHPNAVVAPSRVPPLIYSLPQKLRVIESLGTDTLLLIHFDQAFSEQTGEAFVRGLKRDLGHIQSLCVGANFVFGYKRGGNVELLRRLGAELKFMVHGMAAVSLDGRAVSSTRIREAIRAGDLDGVSQMLGRAYSLAGTVVRGDGLGQQLGFPTANLDATGLALPPHGVYAVHAEASGKTYRAVLNIGYRPTLQNPNPQLRVEGHLIDFAGDLYGQELEVAFVEKLRAEQKFPSLAALRQQIAQDILDAQMRF
ncbi:MAG: bifunctional riboflavin kinase/FAD synthetase [Verrucomicrobia bacterium]|nr:bifunctional riboflavin kinase/FAD synthetase [Verrucomicrobiota bacterium]